MAWNVPETLDLSFHYLYIERQSNCTEDVQDMYTMKHAELIWPWKFTKIVLVLWPWKD